MALYPATLPARHPNLRALDLNRDREDVMRLLKIAFGNQEDLGRRNNSLILTPFMPWKQRLDMVRKGFVPGAVWQDGNQIVGCASLMPAKSIGRYLIANVAVHPDYRGRGIAQSVVDSLIDHVRNIGGTEIRLQVEQENDRAIHVYRRLGFHTQGAVTSWSASPSAHRYVAEELLESSKEYIIRELRSGEWQKAKALANGRFPQTLQWPDPFPDSYYRTNVLSALNNFFDGRAVEPWVLQMQDGLAGMISIRSEWMRWHVLQLSVAEQYRGELELPLLAKAFRLLRTMQRYHIHLDHPANDPTADALFEQFGLQKRRTLAIMRLTV